MPDHMSRERQQIVQAYGAEVILTAAEADMAGAIAHANYRLTTLPHAFSPHQFSNPANSKIHYETTGPEIWQDTDGDLAVLGVGVGTGGTLTGAGQYLKQGILSGISTGAVVYAGLKIGQRSQYRHQCIVMIQPSGGERYLSTALWQA